MWDDSQEPDEDDWPESDEDSIAVSCPECGGEVYEDADLCPHCGNFLEQTLEHPMSNKPLWFVVLGLLGLLATLLALSGLF
jgi:hypothetical protein